MSLAGVRSGQGDGYQTAVALTWVIKMIRDSSISWVEVDSTMPVAAVGAIPVDDVVVGLENGELICCQCKKNQPHFSAWRPSELSDDLEKAGRLLAAEPKARVIFSARADFGPLAKLRAHAQTQPDAATYQASLTPEHQKTDVELRKCWSAPLSAGTATSYSLLCRITFDLTPDADGLRERSLSDLRLVVAHAGVGFAKLWEKLDAMGSRLTAPGLLGQPVLAEHRLTRTQAIELLESAGSTLAPTRREQDVLATFRSISLVGRSWRREIRGELLEREATGEVLAALELRKSAILVTDGPGSGKTCVLLRVVDELERTGRVATLFLQGREFADLQTAQSRAALGLPDDMVALVARMSEWRHTVVVIDSLDVLSLSREHAVLGFFTSLVERLRQIPNVSLVAACRSFDLKYDRRLSQLKWDEIASIGELDWQAVVVPLLRKWDVDPTVFDGASRSLLTNARNLALFGDIVERGGPIQNSSPQALTENYLEYVIRKDPKLGDTALASVESMAASLLVLRRMDIPKSQLKVSDEVLERLLSENVLHQAQAVGRVGFGHQTLLDSLAVRDAERKGLTLLQFIKALPAVPFVRPAVRTFFEHLRIVDRIAFRAQVRAAFASDVAFHLKRLLADSLGRVEPEDADWSLIAYLRSDHPTLFDSLYTAAEGISWHPYWMKHLVPRAVRDQDAGLLSVHTRRVARWLEVDSSGILEFWTRAIGFDWVSHEGLSTTLALELLKVPAGTYGQALPLLTALVGAPNVEHHYLGDALHKYVSVTGSGDALLWQYVAGDVHDADWRTLRLGNQLRLGAAFFRDAKFIAARMLVSDELLDLALTQLETWSLQHALRSGLDVTKRQVFANDFLHLEAQGAEHSHRTSAIALLCGAVREAIVDRAVRATRWWLESRRRLVVHPEAGIRYAAIEALRAAPGDNLGEVAALLQLPGVFEGRTTGALGELIRKSFYFLTETDQDSIIAALLALLDPENLKLRRWGKADCFLLLGAVPAPLRSPAAAETLSNLRIELALPNASADVEPAHGFRPPPFGHETLLDASDAVNLEILRDSARWDVAWAPYSELIGGLGQVQQFVCDAAAKDPVRFLRFLAEHWAKIDEQFLSSIVEGAALHLRYRFGNLQSGSGEWMSREKPTGPEVADLILDELDRHPLQWSGSNTCAGALLACAHVIGTDQGLDRLLFHAVAFVGPRIGAPQHAPDDRDLTTTALNAPLGEIAAAMMVIAERSVELERELPVLLTTALRRLANDPHPAIRAAVLRRLPYVQSKVALGWELFDMAVACADEGIWAAAEACLYATYHGQFGRIQPYLERISTATDAAALETWGRISALAALSNQIPAQTLLDQLRIKASDAAWTGAVSVWVENAKLPGQRIACFAGLKEALGRASSEVMSAMDELFRESDPPIDIPLDLLERYLAQRPMAVGQSTNIYNFDQWLCSMAQVHPESALTATEMYATAGTKNAVVIYDAAPVSKLLTSLFRGAEEREEADGGETLSRVIAVQDSFLAGPLPTLNEWLIDAERP